MGFAEGVGRDWQRKLRSAPRPLEDASVGCIRSLVPLREEVLRGLGLNPSWWLAPSLIFGEGNREITPATAIQTGQKALMRAEVLLKDTVRHVLPTLNLGTRAPALRSPSSWALKPAACRMTCFGHRLCRVLLAISKPITVHIHIYRWSFFKISDCERNKENDK